MISQITAKYIKVVSIIILISLLSGCSKFLDIPAPKTELESQEVLSHPETANAALLDIYSKLVNSSKGAYNIGLLTGIYSDEFNNFSTVPDIASFYSNNVNPDNTYLLTSLWQPFYSYIYQANSIIDGISQQGNLSSQLSRQLIGEAKFIRAFCHFYLTNLFGEIPIVLTSSYNVNASIKRSSISDVYGQIKKDLLEAEMLLPENYVGVDGLSTSLERLRPNRFVASSLLARVYLYTKDYNNSEKQASKVIEAISQYQLNDINNVFLANSIETIFSLQPADNTGYTTPEGYNYILLTTPSTSAANCTSISFALFNAFEDIDKRRDSWTGALDAYKFPYKYKIKSGYSSDEYSIVLRLSEQYLIRAEARAQLGRIDDSLRDLNMIRLRSGLDAKSINNRNDLVKAIFEERNREFFSEWGHRWFDLKRQEDFDQQMENICISKGAIWKPYKRYFPIPKTEIANDPNLTQNEGY